MRMIYTSAAQSDGRTRAEGFLRLSNMMIRARQRAIAMRQAVRADDADKAATYWHNQAWLNDCARMFLWHR